MAGWPRWEECEKDRAARQAKASLPSETVGGLASSLCSAACFRLAHENGQLARVQKIRKLTEAAPRAGFVEPAQLEGIRRRLPEDLQAAITSPSPTVGDGMRFLRSSAGSFDLEAGTLCLDVGSTKNDDGRELDVTDELRGTLSVA